MTETRTMVADFVPAPPCGECGGCQMMEQLKLTLKTIDDLCKPTLEQLRKSAHDHPQDRKAWPKFKRAQEDWMLERDRVIKGLAPYVLCHRLPVIFVPQENSMKDKRP